MTPLSFFAAASDLIVRIAVTGMLLVLPDGQSTASSSVTRLGSV
jgi:hypothetical protein